MLLFYAASCQYTDILKLHVYSCTRSLRPARCIPFFGWHWYTLVSQSKIRKVRIAKRVLGLVFITQVFCGIVTRRAAAAPEPPACLLIRFDSTASSCDGTPLLTPVAPFGTFGTPSTVSRATHYAKFPAARAHRVGDRSHGRPEVETRLAPRSNIFQLSLQLLGNGRVSPA